MKIQPFSKHHFLSVTEALKGPGPIVKIFQNFVFGSIMKNHHSKHFSFKFQLNQPNHCHFMKLSVFVTFLYFTV